jgi:SAF domain-containing protein
VASVSPLQHRPAPSPPQGAANATGRVGRRNVPLLGVGVVLVVVGALGSAALRSTAAERVPVLVVARPVTAGSVVTDADLRETELSPAPGVATVPAAERKKIVGRRAAAPLAEGTVLAESQLASGARLASGEALVPLSLARGRVPAEVGPGDRVAVMVSGATTPQGEGSAGSGVLAEGRVLSVRPDASDATVVSLVVDEKAAAVVMAAAGGGGIGLVLLAAE